MLAVAFVAFALIFVEAIKPPIKRRFAGQQILLIRLSILFILSQLFFRAARTSITASTCPFTLTLGQTWRITPLGSTRKVERMMP